jgi:hypothetical protein
MLLMARTYRRDSRGRFAGGGGGRPAPRAKSAGGVSRFGGGVNASRGGVLPHANRNPITARQARQVAQIDRRDARRNSREARVYARSARDSSRRAQLSGSSVTRHISGNFARQQTRFANSSRSAARGAAAERALMARRGAAAGRGSSASQGGSARGRRDTTRAIGLMRGASRRPAAGLLRGIAASNRSMDRKLNQLAIASRRVGGGRSNPGRSASVRATTRQVSRAATSQRRIAARRP